MKSGYTIDSFIPFDMVIDTEMGLMKLIEFEYNNNFFYNHLLGNDEYVKLLLRDREKRNPLSIIAKNGTSEEELDDMYRQFMETRYNDILRLSPNTNLFHLLKLSHSDECVHLTIVFDNEEQEELFDKRKGEAFRRYNGSIFDKELIQNNGSFYIKYIDALSDHTEIEGKTIYLADYKFNKTEADTEGYYPRMDIYQDLISNVFKFINLYNIDETKIPKG